MKNKIRLFFILFLYVFAFYIGPFSVSLLIAIPLYIKATVNKSFLKNIIFVLSTFYIKKIAKILYLLIFVSLLFPIIFQTYDYSFFRTISMQAIHLVAAIPVLAYLVHKNYSVSDIESYFVFIFVAQTIIQLIVVSNETLGNLILFFNHFDPDEVLGIGSGIRGKALSAATTYHLTIAYGISFIIYIKHFISNKVSLKNIIIGILIFVGIFFAGRSGFVGCLIGAMGYMIYNKNNTFLNKLKQIFKIIAILIISLVTIICIIYYYAPEYYAFFESNVIAYAFEFLYSYDSSGSVETASTNRLLEMWDNDFNYIEFFFGSGKYSNPDGTYYMHVDPGILRHLLFMGILGYGLLIVYQLYLLPFWRMKSISKFYCICILIFVFVMDLKGVTVGLNKFVFSISLLLSFSELYLKNDTDLIENKK